MFVVIRGQHLNFTQEMDVLREGKDESEIRILNKIEDSSELIELYRESKRILFSALCKVSEPKSVFNYKEKSLLYDAEALLKETKKRLEELD